jgi:hypothetical protein
MDYVDMWDKHHSGDQTLDSCVDHVDDKAAKNIGALTL